MGRKSRIDMTYTLAENSSDDEDLPSAGSQQQSAAQQKAPSSAPKQAESGVKIDATKATSTVDDQTPAPSTNATSKDASDVKALADALARARLLEEEEKK